MAKKKQIFVSGCFDMLHSGHVCFLAAAAKFGEIHIGIGSDRTMRESKGCATMTTHDERRFWLSSSSGLTAPLSALGGQAGGLSVLPLFVPVGIGNLVAVFRSVKPR